MIKLQRRPDAMLVSDRLLAAVQERFNYVVNHITDAAIRSGIHTSPYIDEWFDWGQTGDGHDYWSMANHLFLIEFPVITAQQVKALREKTGAGMIDCKNALIEAGGDETKAIEILRKKGSAVAFSKCPRRYEETQTK